MKRVYGDFQTPPQLVAAVLDRLGPVGRRWPRVLEPTCGQGNFVAGLLTGADPPREIIGIEIQGDYVREARRRVAHLLDGSGGTGSAAAAAAEPAGGTETVPAPGSARAPARVHLCEADFFQLDLRRDLAWEERGPLLVVGNPPWVTAAELGARGHANGPARANVKGLTGLEALTGSANFDLAEAVWLKLLRELAGEPVAIALLCKLQVARNVLEYARRTGYPVRRAAVYRVDGRKWFGASTEACLLVVETAGEGTAGRALGPPAGERVPWEPIPFFSSVDGAEAEGAMGFARGSLVADAAAYARAAFADGTSRLEWRQGIKHDAAPVMELTVGPDGYRNGLGERVDVEPEWVYPLCKGADLQRDDPLEAGRALIVTQHQLDDDTRELERRAPRLWAYLTAHRDRFRARRSSIYRGRPDFALFGVGPYAFAPYKVAVASLHRPVRFRVLGPVDGRPVLLDDTCYFVPCSSEEEARRLAALLNSPPAMDLVRALVFPGSKRAVTKALLQRIDVEAIEQRRLGAPPQSGPGRGVPLAAAETGQKVRVPERERVQAEPVLGRGQGDERLTARLGVHFYQPGLPFLIDP